MWFLYFETFFILLFGHFLADFPLQGDYLSKIKNPRDNPPEFWVTGLLAHSTIHAGITFFLTGQFFLAMFVLVTHFIIDYGKCLEWYGKDRKAFLIDQLLHWLVLAIVAGIYILGDV